MTDEEIYQYEQNYEDFECHPDSCMDCPMNDECVYAWDAYNIDGDCIMEK